MIYIPGIRDPVQPLPSETTFGGPSPNIWDPVRPLPSDTPEGGPSDSPFIALDIHISISNKYNLLYLTNSHNIHIISS